MSDHLRLGEGFIAVPSDVLWLRNGRPFAAGEASYDGGSFPPTPWTWQGMVRTRILRARLGDRLAQASRAEIEALIGPPDRLPEGWILRGPLPAAPLKAPAEPGGPVVEPWLPWPLFLSKPDRARQAPPQRARALDCAGWFAPDSAETLLGFSAGHAPTKEGWISARNLAWALLGVGCWRTSGWVDATKRAQGSVSLPPCVKEEPRTGLTVDKSGAAADHQLYTAVYHRFGRDAGLWGALSIPEGAPHTDLAAALTHGDARLGHKERPVCLGPAVAPALGELLAPPALGAGEHHLRLLLLSPAPVDDTHPHGPFPLPDGVTVRGRQVRAGPDIGGFDRYGKGGGRPSHSTWAAGSWWWLTLAEATAEEQRARVAALLNPKTPAERFGFGWRVAAPFDPKTGAPIPPPTQEPDHG